MLIQALQYTFFMVSYDLTIFWKYTKFPWYAQNGGNWHTSLTVILIWQHPNHCLLIRQLIAHCLAVAQWRDQAFLKFSDFCWYSSPMHSHITNCRIMWCGDGQYLPNDSDGNMIFLTFLFRIFKTCFQDLFWHFEKKFTRNYFRKFPFQDF